MPRPFVAVLWPVGLGLALLLAPRPASAEVKLLGVARIPGTTRDKSGLKDTLPDGTPHDQLGGLGSGIAYTGRGNKYVLVSDRGPKDGTVPYRCRFHVMDIAVQPGARMPVRATLRSTTLLRTEDGRPLIGDAAALKGKALRFDPEGVRIGRNGNLFLSDEYGPFLWEFSPQGKRLRVLHVPAHFQPATPAADPKAELPPHNRSGRQPNRGMEGLAIAPDGGTLYGLMQSPLLQDGALGAKNVRVGVNNRLLELNLATGKTREFVYPLASPATGASEIVAVNARQFLVLERDGKRGGAARFQKIYLIDISKATDVSGLKALPARGLPAEVAPVTKRLVIDLLEPRFGLAGPEFPGKVEGLAFGPDLPDGRHLLLVTADNDFIPDRPITVMAFAISPADLPGFQPQQLD